MKIISAEINEEREAYLVKYRTITQVITKINPKLIEVEKRIPR